VRAIVVVAVVLPEVPVMVTVEVPVVAVLLAVSVSTLALVVGLVPERNSHAAGQARCRQTLHAAGESARVRYRDGVSCAAALSYQTA
jgi:hypothetical protein